MFHQAKSILSCTHGSRDSWKLFGNIPKTRKNQSFNNQLFRYLFRTQTRYKVCIIREIKRIYYTDNQLFIIFLYLAILLIFTCFWLNSTLLVHFDIRNFLVSLQNKKTSENKLVNDFTRFYTHSGT